MERWACVDVPQHLLQTLLDAHPGWVDLPVVVVDRDTPQGVIRQCNRSARAAGIRPGLRYGAALALSHEVRAGVVDEARVAELSRRVFAVLQEFSPHIEPSDHRGPEDALFFWLQVTGVDRLFGGFDAWAQRAYDTLKALRVFSSITVGWSRFGTFALSRTLVGWRVLGSEADEQRAVGQVRLETLNLPVKVCEKLAKLAIERVDQLIALPESGVRKRFGPEVHALWRQAHGAWEVPLQPVTAEEPVRVQRDLEDVWDTEQLTFLLKRELHPMLLQLATRHQDLRQLDVVMGQRDGRQRRLEVRPATPTQDGVRIIELCRLQLERLTLTASIMQVELVAHGVALQREQTHLFHDNQRRDQQAASHALARLAVEYPGAVFQLTQHDRHLPESRFSLEPFEVLPRAVGVAEGRQVLTRRILRHPTPLPWFHAERGATSPAGAVVEQLYGPYELSGGWWHDLCAVSLEHAGVRRAYWFAETDRGDIFWVYYDMQRRRWFLQGVVQ